MFLSKIEECDEGIGDIIAQSSCVEDMPFIAGITAAVCDELWRFFEMMGAIKSIAIEKIANCAASR